MFYALAFFAKGWAKILLALTMVSALIVCSAGSYLLFSFYVLLMGGAMSLNLALRIAYIKHRSLRRARP